VFVGFGFFIMFLGFYRRDLIKVVMKKRERKERKKREKR
jgi:hypothetical protein